MLMQLVNCAAAVQVQALMYHSSSGAVAFKAVSGKTRQPQDSDHSEAGDWDATRSCVSCL